MNGLEARAAKIKLVCTDVDGVLTDGSLHYGDFQGHGKSFNVRDGAAVKWLQRAGIRIAFISGLDSPATWNRAKHLGVEDCFAGHLAKLPVLDKLCTQYGLDYEDVAHIGDDLHDLPLLRRAGLAACPQDAVAEVREACHLVVPLRGGQGVLRQVGELILKAQGRWNDVVENYRA